MNFNLKLNILYSNKLSNAYSNRYVYIPILDCGLIDPLNSNSAKLEICQFQAITVQTYSALHMVN